MHRDVKPENILVARNGRVLIGDFGLAGLAEAAGATAAIRRRRATELTQTGAVLGTPAYMAPEQHDGKPADALSDQFSFCVSLYESLHGRRPFPGRPPPRSRRRCEPATCRRAATASRARSTAWSRAASPPMPATAASVDGRAAGRARARRARGGRVNPVLAAGAIGVVLATTATAAIVGTGTHRRLQPARPSARARAGARSGRRAGGARAGDRADRAPRDDGAARTPQARRAAGATPTG